MIFDDAVETLRCKNKIYYIAPTDLNVLTDKTRKIGLIIIRGVMVS